LAQSVRNYVDNLDKIEEVVSNNADNILQAIDLDEFLKDPKKYLLLLGDAFLSEHIDELEQASKEGSRFANEVLENR
tara:strand:- start:405 stop:635 length:231 start_codon:yes stop_codon:yes gene_type:complete